MPSACEIASELKPERIRRQTSCSRGVRLASGARVAKSAARDCSVVADELCWKWRATLALLAGAMASSRARWASLKRHWTAMRKKLTKKQVSTTQIAIEQ